MFKRTHKELKTAQQALTVPKGCRELSDEEMFKVNGGAEEKKESQESKSESVTVQSGNTLSGIVNDYNKANGTNYTVSEVAKNSGISNPDVIHPGQEIKFGTSNSTSNASPSQTGNQGATNTNGNYGTSSGPSTSPSYGNTSSSSSTSSSQYSSASMSSLTNNATPKYELAYYNQMVEKSKAQASGKTVLGKEYKKTSLSCAEQYEMAKAYAIRNEHTGHPERDGHPDSNASALEKIQKSINNNLKYKYNESNRGFMCDNWVQKVIYDAGFDTTKYLPAGNAYSKTCEEHIEAAKKGSSGFTTTLPKEDGAYTIFMGDGHIINGKKLHEHAALLIIDDGKMTVWDNSTGNITTSGYNIGGTAVGARSSTQIDTFGYDSYYYKKIF